jgi:PST family polysaccharide transporter
MNWLRQFRDKVLRNPVLKNAGWLYFDQIARALVVVVAFGAMARKLGPEEYGVLSYAVSFPGMFLPLAMLGLDFVIVRDLVLRPQEEAVILGTSATLKLGAATVSFMAAGLCSMLVPAGHPARPLLLITTLGLLGQPFLLFDFYFQSRIASKYSVMARLVACLGANGLRLWFAARGAPVSWFAWTTTIEVFVYAWSLMFAYRQAGGKWPRWIGDFRSEIARRLLRNVWPIFLADVAIAFYQRFDRLLISHLAGIGELGRYAAAYRLADVTGFFALALINSYYPCLVASHLQGRECFEKNLRRFFANMTRLSIAVAVVFTLGAPLVTRIVLGNGFAHMAPLLVVLVWANVFVTQIAVRGRWFLSDGLQVYTLVFFAMGAAVHLGLLLVVAPRWGALGAAGSFCLAQVIMAVVAPALFKRSRPAAALALRCFWPRRI